MVLSMKRKLIEGVDIKLFTDAVLLSDLMRLATLTCKILGGA